MNEKQLPARAVSRLMIIGIIAGVAGLVLVMLGIGVEWRGFWGGVVIGAGLGIAMVGTYFWGLSNGMRRAVAQEAPKLWRPSEGSAK